MTPTPAPGSPSLTSIRILVTLLPMVFGGYFFGGAASNQNARLDAIYAFAEPGTPDTGSFRIDRFMVSPTKAINTLDWASFDGHHYANKAPGTLWMGGLFYRGLIEIERALSISFEEPSAVVFNTYAINLFVSVLPVALACLCLFELMLAQSVGVSMAVFIALAAVMGTLLFPYSTQLWGHPTGAAFSAMALLFITRGTPVAAGLAGVLVGMAVCSDYLMAISVLGAGALLLCKHPRLTPHFIAGGLIPAAGLMAYHAAYFGGPLVTASQMSNPAFLDENRTLGMFGSLSIRSLWEISFGLRRGLFIQCPILLLSVLGFVHWLRRAPRDPVPYVCVLTSLAYFIANASFNGWHGGATVGPRYLIGALPFLGLGLAGLADPAGTAGTAGAARRRLVLGLTAAAFAVSLCNMLAIAAVNPLAPDNEANPLYAYTYRMLLEGQLSPYDMPIRGLNYHPAWEQIRTFSMWNWGQLMGLPALTSLVPLLAVGGLLGVALKRALRIHAADAARPSSAATPAAAQAPPTD